MGIINIPDLDVATRDEHSTVDLEAKTALRTCPFSSETAVPVDLSSSQGDTWLGAAIKDPEGVFFCDIQTGLLVLDDEEVLKDAKGEVVPENAENAFTVTRYMNKDFNNWQAEG
jgi:hypothetical protein